MYAETKDEKKAQGWTVFVLDTNGNGKRDAYVEPDQPIDPTKDKRINAPFYGVAPSPVDNSVWGSVLGMPGMLVRLTLGSNPPATALSEVYEVPWNNPKAPVQGFAPRGMDVDSNGVVWAVLSSGHHASFDRRKCKGPLNGPTATGQHCPEGWTLYPFPGPNYKGATDSGSADTAYYDFVDRFDMLGVGKDIPLATGNGSEALLALVDGRFLTFRVPYPMGYLCERHGWPDRRSERRLEREGYLVDLRDARAVPRRRGQGDDEQAGEVPGAAGPAREVTGAGRAGWPVRLVGQAGCAGFPTRPTPSSTCPIFSWRATARSSRDSRYPAP